MATLSMPPTATGKQAADKAPSDGAVPGGVVLSAGAAQALGSVAQRLLQKRPRGVLSDNAEVAAEGAELIQVARKEREAKRAKRSFEANARVIPDAATNAVREKQLKNTATRGTVALFNAVSRAQRESNAGEDGKSKPVDRNTFMNLMKRGTRAAEEDDENEEETEKAGWLKDDYLTAKSRKLRDFDRAADADAEEDGDDEEDEEEEYEDEAEFEDEEEELEEEEEDESESE